MSPRQHVAATMSVLERDQAEQREYSIALILRHQRVGDLETLDAVPAVEPERHERVEGDPYEVTDGTPISYELM